jgi:molecular chaperone DnaK (HSP70)
MMREAEENEQADKTAAERVAVLNELEALVYSLSPKEGENGEAAAEAPDYVKEALAWLGGSPSAEVEELREKIKELKEAAAADGGAQGGGEGGGADEPDESDDEEGDEL